VSDHHGGRRPATIPFGRLLAVEMRRCLSRRVVHVLVGLALVGIAVVAVVGLTRLDVPRGTDPTLVRFRDLWRPDGDGTVLPAVIFLAFGAMLGGAVVVGGEWKAGTVTSLLTWEVRRARLLAARLLACAVLAGAIGAALVLLYVVLAALPIAAANDGMSGLDAGWWTALVGVVGRSLLVVSLAAVVGAGIASIGRSSVAALTAVFALEAIVQPAVRGLRPASARWLLGENVAAFVGGEPMVGESFRVSPMSGAVTLVVYVTALAAVALWSFQRRDLAGAS
jgi:ABC-type transport system involved in multi-copper enzyme maturation permease subunit